MPVKSEKIQLSQGNSRFYSIKMWKCLPIQRHFRLFPGLPGIFRLLAYTHFSEHCQVAGQTIYQYGSNFFFKFACLIICNLLLNYLVSQSVSVKMTSQTSGDDSYSTVIKVLPKKLSCRGWPDTNLKKILYILILHGFLVWSCLMQVHLLRGLVEVLKVFFSAGVRKENRIFIKSLLHKLQKYAQKSQLWKQIFKKYPVEIWNSFKFECSLG